jgi:hypothetical protein
MATTGRWDSMFMKPMRMRRRFLFASLVVAIAACGSRTGLLVPFDVEVDSGVADVGPDSAVHRVDAGADVRADVQEEDAGEEDALPPIDVSTPEDVVIPSDCPDAGSTFIYLISETNNLYSFYPPSAELTLVGTIACPSPSMPFSMAVDHTGIAYIVFQDGELFRVSTATTACEPTPFVPQQHGFTVNFGMGFSQDSSDAGESLYVASSDPNPGTGLGPPSQIATIDVTQGYALNIVGTTNPPIFSPELTGTGAGDLFGFWGPDGNRGPNSAIVQIDKATAQVTSSSALPGISQGTGWAFAFWGGDFYTFTAPVSTTVVTRFRPSDGSIVQVLQTDQVIVGAGVSTCAPQQ